MSRNAKVKDECTTVTMSSWVLQLSSATCPQLCGHIEQCKLYARQIDYESHWNECSSYPGYE